jgi:hypothetical protein
MADIICPICKRINDDTAERCWYCQAILKQEPKPEEPGDSDWLSSLRGESKDDVTPKNEAEESLTSAQHKEGEEIPDWLARIRNREQMERESQRNEDQNESEEANNANLPDWLREIKSGDSHPEILSESLELERQIEEKSRDSDPTAFLDAESGGKENEEENEAWLNRLAAWKPEFASETVAPEPAVDDATVGEQPIMNDQGEPSTTSQEMLVHPQDQPEGIFETKEPANSDKSATPSENLNSTEKASTGLSETDEKKPVELPFDIPLDMEIPPGILEEPAAFENPIEAVIEPGEAPEPIETELNSPQSDALSENLGAFTQISTEDVVSNPIDENELMTGQKKAGNGMVDIPIPSQIFPNDLPDWLSSTSVDQIEKQTDKFHKNVQESQESGEEKIEPAKVPAWLQAMRPLEAVTTDALIDETIEEPETEGLLAGIEGAIQSKPIIEPLRKSISYGAGLKVSEKQRNNAILLSGMLEPVPAEILSEIVKNHQTKFIMFRLGIGILLIALAFVGNWLFTNITVTPVLFPPEVVTVYDGVNSLTTEKPILLAGDFEAGLSGELMWSSQSFVQHLMRRNIKIAILSSNPVASAILYKQINEANSVVSAYQAASNVIDLGYLPGGMVGIRSLVTDIRSALPYTLNLQSAWQNPVLQNVNSLNDFGAVVIFTEKAENARNWIEQIQPSFSGTPLYFVVSAQAAPMVQPYFQSGQVAGYIAGLNGSLAYEQILQQPGVSILHLGTYQTVILAVAITLLLGGLISVVRPVDSGKKE